jgi:hypothetical protein
MYYYSNIDAEEEPSIEPSRPRTPDAENVQDTAPEAEASVTGTKPLVTVTSPQPAVTGEEFAEAAGADGFVDNVEALAGAEQCIPDSNAGQMLLETAEMNGLVGEACALPPQTSTV